MSQSKSSTTTRKLKLAVWKFASCDGCQLSLLDCEDQLLELAASIEISHFLEASSATVEGPYDISLVEGSISTSGDIERIKKIRALSKHLVSIGACAITGGIQALRNFRDSSEFLRIVYANPSYIDSLETSSAISEYVPVDFELRGCPISKAQLIEVLSSFLARKRPSIPAYSVCIECKRQGNVCVMVAKGIPCLGPVTQAGCGALCPKYYRGCYGCFGPQESPNTLALAPQLKELGMTSSDISRSYRTFNAEAPAFRSESMRHEQKKED